MDVLLMTFLWAQRKLYEAFLKSELVHLAVQPKGSPLAAITVRSPSKFFFLYCDTVYLPLPTYFLLFRGIEVQFFDFLII